MKQHKNINLKMPHDTWAFLKHTAVNQERSVTAIIVECIEKYKNKFAGRLTESGESIQAHK